MRCGRVGRPAQAAGGSRGIVFPVLLVHDLHAAGPDNMTLGHSITQGSGLQPFQRCDSTNRVRGGLLVFQEFTEAMEDIAVSLVQGFERAEESVALSNSAPAWAQSM